MQICEEGPRYTSSLKFSSGCLYCSFELPYLSLKKIKLSFPKLQKLACKFGLQC